MGNERHDKSEKKGRQWKKVRGKKYPKYKPWIGEEENQEVEKNL